MAGLQHFPPPPKKKLFCSYSNGLKDFFFFLHVDILKIFRWAAVVSIFMPEVLNMQKILRSTLCPPLKPLRFDMGRCYGSKLMFLMFVEVRLSEFSLRFRNTLCPPFNHSDLTRGGVMIPSS